MFIKAFSIPISIPIPIRATQIADKKKGKRHAVHTYAYWKMQVGHWHYQILLYCDGY